jgi:hypothetical protein
MLLYMVSVGTISSKVVQLEGMKAVWLLSAAEICIFLLI